MEAQVLYRKGLEVQLLEGVRKQKGGNEQRKKEKDSWTTVGENMKGGEAPKKAGRFSAVSSYTEGPDL